MTAEPMFEVLGTDYHDGTWYVRDDMMLTHLNKEIHKQVFIYVAGFDFSRGAWKYSGRSWMFSASEPGAYREYVWYFDAGGNLRCEPSPIMRTATEGFIYAC